MDNQYIVLETGILLFYFTVLMACSTPPDNPLQPDRPDIDSVRARQEDSLMDLEGVVGVASGSCGQDACLIVMVVQDTDEVRSRIPATIEGYKVQLLEVGDVRIDPLNPSH